MVTKRQNIVQLQSGLLKFKDGRESLEDDPRSRRPQTTHTTKNIELKSLFYEFFNTTAVVHLGYVEKGTPLLVNTIRKIV